MFAPTKVAAEITQVQAKMNTFDVSTDPEKKEQNKGMNITTPDRPIDNIRNITFKGVGGDRVRLDYPNIYEVNIYKQVGDKLILKEIPEIRDAIKEYLIKKAAEYNIILATQQSNKQQYYTTYGPQFDYLGQLDVLANPMNHTYDPIPTNYFIDKLIDFLDLLEAGFGSKYVYGEDKPNDDDEKLDMIAKLFYYQNITRKERLKQEKVDSDMMEIKASFDINKKTTQVANMYMTEGGDQGKFITPVYNNTGYEIGYINSDGEDYISSASMPSFIQQIQAAQEKSVVKVKPVLEESNAADLQNAVDDCEGVDTNGQAMLFDLKTK